MPRWRTDDLDDAWVACERAIAEARSSAEELRLGAGAPVGFEALIGTIGDLLAPLDEFGAAADRFLDLRRRR
jgi:hypothetical protein